MQIKDFIGLPFEHVNIYWILWMLYVLITIIPGVVLWAVTLGMFRYFNISNMLCEYLVNKDIKVNGY